MTIPLEDWDRKHYTECGDSPFLFYVVFGSEASDLRLSRSQHRCDSIPEDLSISCFGPDAHPEVLDGFREGYIRHELRKEQPQLAETVEEQTRCVIVQGAVANDTSLNYFRNTIGLLTALLDAGDVAIHDPQTFQWWTPEEWRAAVFEPSAALPRRHVVVLVSDEGARAKWLHTRGMRKFGRPDLSVRGVPSDRFDAVVDMINKFIDFQACGGVIPEGQEIRMQALPRGMHCTHVRDSDDPDFNNSHVEIRWPTDG